MRNEKETDGKTSNPLSENMKSLKKINTLIKDAQTREEGFQNLQQVDTDDLEVGELMYYRYVKGKYYSLTFRSSETKDIELLERANEQYDEIAGIAKEYGVKPKKPQYLFVRINTKFQLSKLVKGERSTKLLAYAKFLSSHAMKYYGHDKSTSFAWIHQQLEGQ